MLTPIQRNALRQAIDDGGAVTIGGQGNRKIRKDVIERLWVAGYLQLRGGSITEDDWIITDAGRKALAESQRIYPLTASKGCALC